MAGNEVDVNARLTLSEIEAGGPKEGVRPGDKNSGRLRQFNDPDFPPNAPRSLGQLARIKEVNVQKWKCAVEVNAHTHTRAHTHTYTRTHTHTHTHARTYTHTYTHTHTRTYAHYPPLLGEPGDTSFRWGHGPG